MTQLADTRPVRSLARPGRGPVRSHLKKVTMIAADPLTGGATVIEGEGVDVEAAKAAAKTKIPHGWRAVSVRTH
jgi:hypothetical protein